MFTGIVETLGEVVALDHTGTNLNLTIKSDLTPELKIDQSVSHNGVCLTVVALNGDTHTVNAIDETLQKTNLGDLHEGNIVNLERAMVAGARLDGHMVQGHVDATGTCTSVEDEDGSWRFTFSFDKQHAGLLVEKGSICIDGVSLTLVDVGDDHFSVAIIPYTFQHTGFKNYKPGHQVNLEFDILGKYIARQMAAWK